VPLFEKISLEGAQSGLSWLTILRKREAYQKTFHGFDIDKVAAMAQEDVEQIVAHTADDPRQMVVRHAGKIQAVIHNAKCIQTMRQETNDENDNDVFDKLMWSFCNDQPIVNRWSGKKEDMPSKSPESEHMSKELKKLGFKFVGPTTCYAFMQSVGMVIDHPVGSNEYKATLERLQTRKGGYQER
jgi:DNA-3-methyladenine glycosylase I